jgi:nucleotide-binding universal stress UspA family protein
VPHTYIVGVSGTAGSWRALAYAAGLARRHDGRLVVVHAAGLPERFALWPETVPLARRASNEAAGQLRRAVAQTLADDDLDWALRAEAGTPFAVLVRVAGMERADAVVVGTSRRRVIRRSLAARLTTLGRHPIIVVP